MDKQDTFVVSTAVLKEVIKWGVPFLGAAIAVFFTPLLDNIKLRLNRADLRAKQFEEFATDLSNFIFLAELHHEYYEHGWTTKEDLDPIIKDYNDAITTIRKKEFVYLAWAQRFWSSSELPLFKLVIADVKEVDKSVHAFNNAKATPDLISAQYTAVEKLKENALALLAKP